MPYLPATGVAGKNLSSEYQAYTSDKFFLRLDREQTGPFLDGHFLISGQTLATACGQLKSV
jgi:hypothetical protein